MLKRPNRALAAGAVIVALTGCESVASLLPSATEQWQPKPPVAAPRDAFAPPPADALILFDGRGMDEWVAVDSAGPAGWRVVDGTMVVEKSAGNIETKRRFRNYQLHIEWRIPSDIMGSGQGRGNSGLFLASTGGGDDGYEIQILDSWRNETYVNGQAGAIYKQHPPRANPARPPGEWQSYDIIWTAPRFTPDGKLSAPARISASFNGVPIHDNAALAGETVFIGRPRYRAHGPAPIKLQAHRDPSAPIAFRNIWVRALP